MPLSVTGQRELYPRTAFSEAIETASSRSHEDQTALGSEDSWLRSAQPRFEGEPGSSVIRTVPDLSREPGAGIREDRHHDPAGHRQIEGGKSR